MITIFTAVSGLGIVFLATLSFPVAVKSII